MYVDCSFPLIVDVQSFDPAQRGLLFTYSSGNMWVVRGYLCSSGRATANTANEQMPKNHDGVVEELD